MYIEWNFSHVPGWNPSFFLKVYNTYLFNKFKFPSPLQYKYLFKGYLLSNPTLSHPLTGPCLQGDHPTLHNPPLPTFESQWFIPSGLIREWKGGQKGRENSSLIGATIRRYLRVTLPPLWLFYGFFRDFSYWTP